MKMIKLAVVAVLGTVAAAANAASYVEGFETGAPGFTTSGYWHVTQNFPQTGGFALGYVENETPGATPNGDYNGNTNASAFSPFLTLTAGSMLTLSAVNFNEIGDSPDFYDRLRIGLSTDGVNITTLLASTSTVDGAPTYFAPQGTDGGYTPLSFNLSAFAGQTVSIAFNYASIDGIDNGHPGARIDDLSVSAIAGVPEPTQWALMLGGFGLMGGALRRRRSVSTVFA